MRFTIPFIVAWTGCNSCRCHVVTLFALSSHRLWPSFLWHIFSLEQY